MNAIINNLRVVTVVLLSWLAVSCSRPVSIVGRIDGVWETEWDDYIGKDDVDEIRMKETLVLTPDKTNPRHGKFGQIFAGEVEFDDFDYEQTLDFRAAVSGTWRIIDNDNLEMSYDLETLRVSTGKSNVKVDYTDAVVDLLTGDVASAVVGGLMGSEVQNKANERINKAVSKQVDNYFKNYLRELKHNKKAIKGVKIERGMMKCKINTGFLGREAIYDQKVTATTIDNALQPQKSTKSVSKKR